MYNVKTIFNLFTLFLMAVALASCSDDNDDVLAESSLEVNYANVSGIWQLTSWNGDKMDADSRYYYISFDRSETNGERNYKIHTNLNSFVSQRISGSFELSKNEDLADIISGVYHYTLDTNDAWAHRYAVVELSETTMKWIALDDASEVRIYTRRAEIPADIVAGARVAVQ